RVVRRRDRPERRGHVRRRVERDPAVPRELVAAPPARSGRPSHRRLAPLLRVRPVPVPGGARRLAGGSRPRDRTAGTVSAHAALGLVALNALFLVAGCGVLFAIRGWRSWSELLRLAGLAYLLGVAAVTLIETWALVAGASAHVAVVLAISLGTAAAGLGAGAVLGRRPPRTLLLAEPRRREPFLWLGVLGAGLVGLWLAAFLRVAQGQGLSEYDAWAFWTTKAKAIYFFGQLDPTVFTTVYNPSYPILVPALEAMDFHFMGAPDTTLLHVQFWALLAGFVFAVAGLLRPRVPLAIV